MRRLIAALAATALLVVGSTGVAAAQGDADSPGSSAERAHRRPRRVAVRIAAHAAAEAIGVTVAELRDAVRGGQTVAAIAESKGVSSDDVEQAVLTALTDALARAVSEQRISEERAARIRERLPDIAERLVHQEPKQHQETPRSSTSI